MVEPVFARRVKQPWVPIPDSSQEFALDTRAQVTLYHGARGPGKTDTQLMRFYRRVGMGYGPYWKGIIFDREYKQLGDLIAKSRRHFSGFNDGAKFLSSSADLKWVWPTGEELLFRSARVPADYWNYHGQEYPYIGWNELCKYPTPELFEALMSCNRSSFTVEKDAPLDSRGKPIDIGPIPLEVFATANPYGPGHGWVKRRFIDPAPSGTVVRKLANVFDPKTQTRIDIETTQVAIFGSYRENIYLDAQYVANLEAERDPNKRKAWLHGDWNIVAGGALDDVWRPDVHVVSRFVVPSGWRIDRAFDWGSSHPAACTWWAEADGTSVVLAGGKTFSPPKGSLICIAELYFADTKQTNVGLKWSAARVAERIRDMEVWLLDRKWISKQPWPGPADNQIRNVIMSDIDTIETQMQKVGVRWTESDKSKGSRTTGLQLIRDRLYNSIQYATIADSKPGLYVMDNCRNCIATIPVLPRDEDNMDDVDTEAEDHLYDTWRYRALAASNRYATRFNFAFPT